MYGLLIGSATITCILIVEKIIEVKKIPISKNEFWNNIFVIFLLSILGGRIYHVLDNLEIYTVNPLSIIYLWGGGFGIFGSIFLVFLYFLVYSKYKKTTIYLYLDLICLICPIIIIAGRVGNIFNKELNNSSIEIPVLIIITLINFLQFKKIQLGQGIITSAFLITYGTIRNIEEFFRDPKYSFLIHNTNLTYLFSTALVLLGIIILINLKSRKIKKSTSV